MKDDLAGWNLQVVQSLLRSTDDKAVWAGKYIKVLLRIIELLLEERQPPTKEPKEILGWVVGWEFRTAGTDDDWTPIKIKYFINAYKDAVEAYTESRNSFVRHIQSSSVRERRNAYHRRLVRKTK